ncbi:hypothetical protein VNO80_26846 [Phaseolus coccineus]|uniref:Uncharacterized protein n=1 Tax=Phaseolus coccineus TaxID=3886 RepID=A0AAN9QEU4_PHACN
MDHRWCISTAGQAAEPSTQSDFLKSAEVSPHPPQFMHSNLTSISAKPIWIVAAAVQNSTNRKLKPSKNLQSPTREYLYAKPSSAHSYHIVLTSHRLPLPSQDCFCCIYLLLQIPPEGILGLLTTRIP